MSFIKVQHQHAKPPMNSPAREISSYDGDDIWALRYNLVKRLFGNAAVLTQVVLLVPLFLLIELLMWLALRDSQSQS